MESNILEAGRSDSIHIPVGFLSFSLRRQTSLRVDSSLFLEYARVSSLDRDAMTYKEDLEH